ncbi:unnamed protein product [Caenorhabditis sp. 36 PRJEB53466]|nr:unnamed protein product [Caenorhabditis sp. 36 PRJEB53466]
MHISRINFRGTNSDTVTVTVFEGIDKYVEMKYTEGNLQITTHTPKMHKINTKTNQDANPLFSALLALKHMTMPSKTVLGTLDGIAMTCAQLRKPRQIWGIVKGWKIRAEILKLDDLNDNLFCFLVVADRIVEIQTQKIKEQCENEQWGEVSDGFHMITSGTRPKLVSFTSKLRYRYYRKIECSIFGSPDN